MPAIVISAPISSNHAAPVSAGGTGATTAAAARTNLDVYSKSEVTNAISQSTAIASQTVTMQSGFSLASWGFLTAYKIGNLLVISGQGIRSSSVISASTLMANVSGITFKDNTVAVGFVDGATANTPIFTAIKGAGGRININNVATANANIYFQLVALIE